MARIYTPNVRASYPKLFEPEIGKNDDGKTTKCYSIALLIEDTIEGNKFLAEAEKAAEEIGRAKFGDRYDKLRDSPTFKWAIRRDVKKYEKCEPKIIAYINARSYDTPPGVVSIYPDPKTGKPAAVTDPSVVYPGAYVKASLHAYAYDLSKSKGVSFGLGNVQVLQHLKGTRIDDRVAAEDDFEADLSIAAELDNL